MGNFPSVHAGPIAGAWMATASPEIVPCPEADRAEALARFYQKAAPPRRAALVAGLLADEARGALDLGGLWIARQQGRIVGALLTTALAGRAGAIWPPEVIPGRSRAEVADALIRAGLEAFRGRGVGVVQALLEVSAARASGDLARGGIPYVTDLIYLRRPTLPPLPIPPNLPLLVWESYRDDRADAFVEVLEASYEGSLDMPELDGLRSLAEVIAGHRASGRFDPDRWWIGRAGLGGLPVVLVIVADQADGTAWEVTYLGVSLRMQGRGLGRAALAFALEQARPRVPVLELAVDARNAPALRLYRRAGFRPFDRRAVHLALLGGMDTSQ